MFQLETGFHTNSWFSVSGLNSKNSKLKNESDLFKIIDCFIDCHGSVHSDYVSFVIK